VLTKTASAEGAADAVTGEQATLGILAVAAVHAVTSRVGLRASRLPRPVQLRSAPASRPASAGVGDQYGSLDIVGLASAGADVLAARPKTAPSGEQDLWTTNEGSL
jgi:hypothetical protein